MCWSTILSSPPQPASELPRHVSERPAERLPVEIIDAFPWSPAWQARCFLGEEELETAQLPGGYDAVRDCALAADAYFFVADGATGRALLESYNAEVSSVARRR